MDRLTPVLGFEGLYAIDAHGAVLELESGSRVEPYRTPRGNRRIRLTDAEGVEHRLRFESLLRRSRNARPLVEVSAGRAVYESDLRRLKARKRVPMFEAPTLSRARHADRCRLCWRPVREGKPIAYWPRAVGRAYSVTVHAGCWRHEVKRQLLKDSAWLKREGTGRREVAARG